MTVENEASAGKKRPFKIDDSPSTNRNGLEGSFCLSEEDAGAQTASEAEKNFASTLSAWSDLPKPESDDNGKLNDFHEDLMKIYKDALYGLRKLAEDFVNGEVLYVCWRRLGEAKGAMEARLSALNAQYKHKVKPIYQPPDNDKLYDGLTIELGAGKPTEDQIRLVAELKRANTVVSIVFAERTSKDQRQKKNDYVTDLISIGKKGLEREDNAITSLRSLQAFREDFYNREAPAVKNRHVRKLGFRVGWVSISFFVLFLLATAIVAQPRTGWLEWALGSNIASKFGEMITPLPYFLLLCMGACIGTWLSFTLRRTTLTFEQLSMLEDDMLTPMPRIFFVLGLTIVFGMLLYCDLISITIGTVQVDVGSSQAGFAVPLLLGLLCGIAEIALAGVVRSRADEVIGRATGDPASRDRRAIVASVTPDTSHRGMQ